MGVQIRENKSDVLTVALTVAQVAQNTTAEQTFNVGGVQTTDFVEVCKPTHSTGLGIVNTRCSAPGVIAITFMNSTGAPITPPAGELYLILIERPEGGMRTSFNL